MSRTLVAALSDREARERARLTLVSEAQQNTLSRFLDEDDARWRERTVCAQRVCGGS
jgi:hypothetical protein